MVEDSKLWDIICDGPYVPMKKLGETGPMVPKDRKEYSDIDRKDVEKNYHAKKIMVKQSKIDMLTTEYELFRMKDNESIQDMHTRFTSIINKLHSLGDVIPRNMLALAAWGDFSSESEREPDAENSSIMAVETEATKYGSLIMLMAQSDDDEEDENDEINFRDVQRNLKSYSSKRLRSLTNVLIDAYYRLINDKEILTIELGDAEKSRDDLVVCVVDLNETIANLEKQKEVLNEKINSVENKRDDLMVVVVDLKGTIEGFSNEKHTLEEKIAATEQERDDFLEVASETHIKIEKELNDVKTSLYGELEKNRQLQDELEKVKIDLEKSLKWTWSSDAVTTMYFNNSGNRHGIGFQKEKIPYNPHSKYIIVPDN
ncbi:uncharacterized protein [Nicotiana sylvestris]|uniref:uncharacterized protein n=1 Tax=Nicotiana sylvestris TaxID=4096 RepID=UPI00388CBDC5